jgi:hypothetical protein
MNPGIWSGQVPKLQVQQHVQHVVQCALSDCLLHLSGAGKLVNFRVPVCQVFALHKAHPCSNCCSDCGWLLMIVHCATVCYAAGGNMAGHTHVKVWLQYPCSWCQAGLPVRSVCNRPCAEMWIRVDGTTDDYGVCLVKPGGMAGGVELLVTHYVTSTSIQCHNLVDSAQLPGSLGADAHVTLYYCCSSHPRTSNRSP